MHALPPGLRLDGEDPHAHQRGRAESKDIDLLLDVANNIEGNTICALGDAAAWPVQSYLKKFRDEFEEANGPPGRPPERGPIDDGDQGVGAMPKVTIDGREIEVEAGTTILQAALSQGAEVPHYCYHPGLSIAGNCRMCLVEVEKAPKLVIACATPVADGMVVNTETNGSGSPAAR